LISRVGLHVSTSCKFRLRPGGEKMFGADLAVEVVLRAIEDFR
jgi:hypothetical protein